MHELKGKPISDNILANLKENISNSGIAPGLAIVLVGEDEASKLYVSLKKKKAQEVGINFFLKKFSGDADQKEIISEIEKLNRNKKVDGVIVQLPLPEKFDTQKIINSISLEKDVDGFSFGRQSKLEPVFSKAIMKMIKDFSPENKGKKALAIVNSEEFGRVMKIEFEKEEMVGEYLLGKNFQNEIEKIKNFDVIVSATGISGILKGDFFKNGAIVIDGGISKIKERVLGDVDFESVKDKNIILSPVPGGVGPVTIACLLENVYIAYLNKRNK